MSIKKMMLLAGMAMAVVAFAAPAMAVANEMTDEGTPVAAGTEAQLSGTAKFTSIIFFVESGIECNVHATLTAETAETGQTEFEITTSSCKGFGFLNGCEVVADELTGNPWETHVSSSNTLTVTDVTIHSTQDSECAMENIFLQFGEVTATVDDPASISSVTLSGTGMANELSATASGELSVTPANTYEIN